MKKRMKTTAKRRGEKNEGNKEGIPIGSLSKFGSEGEGEGGRSRRSGCEGGDEKKKKKKGNQKNKGTPQMNKRRDHPSLRPG